MAPLFYNIKVCSGAGSNSRVAALFNASAREVSRKSYPPGRGRCSIGRRELSEPEMEELDRILAGSTGRVDGIDWVMAG